MFKVQNLIHEADLRVLFCALPIIDQCLPNAMQMYPIEDLSDSSFSLLLLLQQAKKKEK
jgi:hypothetical protein